MAKNTQLTMLAVDTEADAFAKLMDGGFIDIYGGDQPKNADMPVNGQTMSVSLSLSNPAFLPADAGVITANPIGSGIIGASVDKAQWARVYRADHQTAVMDVSVGTRDANIILPTTQLVAGILVTCSSFKHVVAKSTSGS